MDFNDQYEFSPALAEPDEPIELKPGQENATELGMVYKKSTGIYTVHTPQAEIVQCEISNRLRKILIYPTADPNSLRPVVRSVKTISGYDPLAVGNWVRFRRTPEGRGLIVEALPRRSKLTRRTAVPMPTAHPFEQVIVANVDQVAPVFAAAQPTPKWNLLDRYLVSAESLDLPSLIVINKLDLLQAVKPAEQAELLAVVEEYRRAGYPVLLVSAHTGEGIPELSAALQGKITVLVGKSGVGKSSLLNALQPGLGLRVQQVNQTTGKGKHTTTHLEMFPLELPGAASSSLPAAIVDTPGVREFGLWEIESEDLALYFPEMRPYVGQCKFGLDCRHDGEPGCVIRKAVQAGLVSPRRYQSLIHLQEET